MQYQSELFGSWPIPEHCKTEAQKALSRRSDPATSREAASSQTEKGMTETKRLILKLLADHGPMTDFALHRRLRIIGHKVSESGARTRRSSLVNDHHLIEDSGETIKLDSGRKSTVWRLVG